MTPQEFHQLLQESELRNKEFEYAWKLYKFEGPEKALEFVRGIKDALAEIRKSAKLKETAISHKVWGLEYIDQGAINKMVQAMRLPIVLAGALMPDAHQGYGLPIGGVMATDNAVVPYAVGVDIACRMMLTLYPVDASILQKPMSAEFRNLKNALIENTIFGSGAAGVHDGKIDHSILDEVHWKTSPLLWSLRLTAIRQIGTSGTGNHFVEWGELNVTDENNPLNLKAGSYLALLSHSGSRGVGFKIADHYTKLAMSQLSNLNEEVRHLAWLGLDTDAGKEYWEAMELAGRFASANHHVIHERVAGAVGLAPIATVENHHNFAWREKIMVDGREVEAIVHRKGATPAGCGVLGVIPGTMADLGYVVVGKGNASSLNSASHGSGRQMSRSSALKKITPAQHNEYLVKRGVTLIGGGLDESPEAYKPIQKVIGAQSDLVEIVASFQPRIVRMAEERDRRFSKPAPVGVVDAEGD